MSTTLKSLSAVLFILCLIQIGCKPESKEVQEFSSPPQPKTEIQDSTAAEMVAAMVKKMGGYENWDKIKYISWSFFGARHLIWDKEGGRVRIESPRDTMIYLIDLHNDKGRIIKSGEEITQDEEHQKLVKRGKGIWINDSYWIFMPFKLQDPGVSVNYAREDTMMGGLPSSVLALTFNGVGSTPNNKYELYVDKEDGLIKQWAYFKTADQETPPRIWPWDNYKEYGGIQLSTDRSDKSGPSNVRIYESLDDKVFESFDPFEYY